jgi:hypothetical protein
MKKILVTQFKNWLRNGLTLLSILTAMTCPARNTTNSVLDGDDDESVHTNALVTTNPPAITNPVADQLMKDFPSIYFYAGDACLRETTRDHVDFPQSYDEFVSQVKVSIDDLKKEDHDNVKVRIRLQYPDDPDKYWLFELTGKNKQWKLLTALKFWNGKQDSDLFEDTYLAGTKIMGSMKPYFEKVLKAYSEGKGISTVFPKK